jgi:hypothetical protein
LTPGKLELLAEWLPSQDWFTGDVGGGLVRVAAARFVDPDGAVGIETMLVGAGDHVFHVPLTYRGAPLAGGEAFLIGEMEHSVLGPRWVYDGTGDQVYRAEEITDSEPDDCAVAAPGRWIVDPDGAVVRAGLVRHYGARHGLWQLDPRIAYLTGDAVPPGVRGFEILARLKLDEKAIRRELQARAGGALEILVRGVDVDPDRLRARLKLRGTVAHTLVVTRIGRNAVVFVCAPTTRTRTVPR